MIVWALHSTWRIHYVYDYAVEENMTVYICCVLVPEPVSCLLNNINYKVWTNSFILIPTTLKSSQHSLVLLNTTLRFSLKSPDKRYHHGWHQTRLHSAFRVLHARKHHLWLPAKPWSQRLSCCNICSARNPSIRLGYTRQNIFLRRSDGLGIRRWSNRLLWKNNATQQCGESNAQLVHDLRSD